MKILINEISLFEYVLFIHVVLCLLSLDQALEAWFGRLVGSGSKGVGFETSWSSSPNCGRWLIIQK